MPFLLLGLGSLAGLFLDNFIEDSPEQVTQKIDLARAQAERLDKIKDIIKTLSIVSLILVVLYFLATSGILKKS